MSLGHGSRIVTDGLVFAYDMGSRQSFKGAPYKNELLNSTNGWSGDGVDQAAFTKGLVDSGFMYRGTPVYLWSPGTSNNVYLNGNGADLDYSSLSTEWTFSCFVKREDGLPITSLNAYMYYPSSDGAAAATIQDMGDGWYRIYRTRTGASNYLSLVGFTGFATGVKYFLAGPMVTKTQFAVEPTPAQVTRSNTEALLDWKNSNIITASSLLYNSDNTFSFDGTNRYIQIMDSATADTYFAGNNFSYDVWFKSESTTHTDTQSRVINRDLSDYFGCLVYQNTGYPQTLSIHGEGSPASQNFTGVIDSGWNNVQVIHVFNGDVLVYLNGNLINSSGEISWNGGIGSSRPILVGMDTEAAPNNAQRFIGQIPVVRMYNRALSATEVKQNFNALRGRFGI